jgi:outer membrane protein assembly factor BamE (lipoprotein component of BamABCDE complex)
MYIFIIALIALSLSGCGNVYNNDGINNDKFFTRWTTQLNEISSMSQSDVQQKLGEPSLIEQYSNSEVWFYIKCRTKRNVIFKSVTVVSSVVIRIEFAKNIEVNYCDDNLQVTNVKIYKKSDKSNANKKQNKTIFQSNAKIIKTNNT